MIKLIRHNKAIGYLILLILLALTKLSLFDAPVLEEKEIPFLFDVSGISFDPVMSGEFQKTMVIILLFIQGIMLQWVLVRHRFVDSGSPIIPFLYVFSALVVPDHFYFNDALWINFVILYLVNIVLSAYEMEGLKDVSFLNIGTFTTVAILILPSMWVLFLFILIALSLFVVITDRQVWLVILASVMMIILLFSIIYLTGQLELSALQKNIIPQLPSVDALDIGASILLITMLLFGMIAVMASISILQLRANKIRNQFWSFVLLYITALTVIFIYPDTKYYSFQLLVVPFTSILSFILLNSKSRWFYEGFFILTVWSIFIIGIGYFS